MQETRTPTNAPHDCSKPKDPKPSADDFADRWGLGRPDSPREVRLSTGVIRNPHGFVGKPLGK